MFFKRRAPTASARQHALEVRRRRADGGERRSAAAATRTPPASPCPDRLSDVQDRVVERLIRAVRRGPRARVRTDERRARRRQAGRPDVARRRRAGAAGAEDAPGRPHRHARSAGDRRAAAGRRQRDAAGAVPLRPTTRNTSPTSGSGSRPRPTTPGIADGRRRAGWRPLRARRRRARTGARRSSAARYLQMPPAFSAKKIGGRPAYELARAGHAPELKPVEVTVTRARAGRSGRTRRHGCGSCARAASTSGRWRTTSGQRLGCGAHSRRCAARGPASFELADAVPLDAIEADGRGERRARARAGAAAAGHARGVVLTRGRLRPSPPRRPRIGACRRGRGDEPRDAGGRMRLLDADGGAPRASPNAPRRAFASRRRPGVRY